VRIIGTSQARMVVLAFGITTVSRRELLLYGIPAGVFLRHSEVTASVAMAICKQVRPTEAGVAYAGGLLHDMGKVLLNEVARVSLASNPSYREFAAAVQAGTEPLLALEQRAFGTDHGRVGADVATLWKLPDSMVDAIGRHHELQQGGEPSIGVMVALANAVAGQVDEEYPALQREPLGVLPLVPVEPLLEYARDVLVRGQTDLYGGVGRNTRR
jgi:putative nucleotidyltransferase with HDIG domain